MSLRRQQILESLGEARYNDASDEDSLALVDDKVGRSIREEPKSPFPVIPVVLGATLLGIIASATIYMLTQSRSRPKIIDPAVIESSSEAEQDAPVFIPGRAPLTTDSGYNADSNWQMVNDIQNAPWFRNMVRTAPRLPTPEEMAGLVVGADYVIKSANNINGQSSAAVDDGSKSPIPDQPRIDYELVKTTLCPLPTYNVEKISNRNVDICTNSCPVGFETVWFEMVDNKFQPYETQVPDLDKDGVQKKNPDGTPKTKGVVQGPQPWCRATCPPQLISPTASNWWMNDQKPASDFLSGDARITRSRDFGDVIITTDAGAGESSAYCKVSEYTRKIHRGGSKFVCGWCTVSLSVNKDARGTSTNRHNCDTEGENYSIDFTNWCMRRRLIPNFLQASLETEKHGNITNTAICASVGGEEGKPKYSTWVASPKGCMNGDLLPILAIGYGRGRTSGGKSLVDTLRNVNNREYVLIRAGVAKPEGHQVVFTGAGQDWSAFLEACYDKCPTWMVPFGSSDKHLCREACPPNTYVALNTGKPMCKKQAFLKNVFISDLDHAVREVIAQWVIHRTSGGGAGTPGK